VLTGTPLENKLEELVSIVQFVDRYRLGPTWRLLHEHQLRDEHGRVIGYRRLDDIAHTLAPIMIRRRKKEVLSQLPERVDHNRFVPMTTEQLRLHEENREIVARIVARWRKTRFLSEADQRRLTCALQNMRMSCNSTYLLDHETDCGIKAGELLALLEDLFEEPDAKAVVFSQWLGTHELIAQRLAARRWGHVLFHGGVPSDQRGSLVQRFREDPQCRVFLSTDAGGLGLNLQHAATVINMDLPWNPAVLEQRIGRVYRLGRRRGVQVVNLIARGTIEEGMLSLHGFKKSLFAGVLDGGNADVFLHGTRLSRFMEGVEKATRATGRVQSQEPALQQEIASAVETADTQASASAVELAAPVTGREPGAAATDPWQTLLDAGLKFIVHLSQARAETARGSGEVTADHSWLETDASTGRSYLRLPLPAPEALRKLTNTLEGLLSGLPKS